MRSASTLFFLVSLAVSSFATVAQVEADIANISTSLNTVDASINAFPTSGGTLAQALAIHNNAVALGTPLGQGTTDTQGTAGPISESDGRTILTSVEALEPVIDDALTKIAARKAAFQALPIGGIPALVKQDINNLCSQTATFETALIALCPTDLQGEATALKNRIDAACAAAIAAYADV
ncbi:hydrophobic surface binding protein A-domain-containing protein [Collybia nuda]|uniref:Hydrophobic surface binding protein A-domain-containing protein n=1 Tax=Collybia nuda TaxID=64659 RepID=A0A9P5XXR5_9AGAR|nr:hydrophobic surface binding protein A-domain-containing protein [Collybia nuda]